MTTNTAATPVAKASAPEHTPAGEINKRDLAVVYLLLVSAFVVILNETVMGIALPRLMEDLKISANVGQWLTTAFLLTMAVVIPITGFLLQRFNTRPIFIAAMTLFSLGTLVSAVSPGFELLVVGRVIQASGTAIMMPLLMTTVLRVIPPAHRGRMMGNISIVISVAPALGPTLSGAILSVLDWRWIFILVLPIALAALALGAARIVNISTPQKSKIDVVSVVMSALGFGGIVYGLSALGHGGEDANLSIAIASISVGAVVLALFVWRQLRLQKTDSALLDLRTFLSRNFSISIALMAVVMMSMFGSFILIPIYLQNILGLETLQAGLMLLPGGLAQGLLAPFVGRLYDRFGPARLLVPGSIVVSAAFWAFASMNEFTTVGFVLATHVALSIGLAFMFTPLFTAGLGSIAPKLYSHGSAIVGTVQQVAGAAGTALFVAIMSVTAVSMATEGAAPLHAAEGGIKAAFTVGAFISLVAIAGAFFVRKPESFAPASAPAEHASAEQAPLES